MLGRAVVLTALTALTALAAPAGATDLADALLGSEIRMASGDISGIRRDVWRLDPGGTLAGYFRFEPTAEAEKRFAETGHVSGRWRLDQGVLCVEGQGIPGDAGDCYRVEQVERLSSGYRIVATHTTSGKMRELFVYPRRKP